jgi:thioredoxin
MKKVTIIGLVILLITGSISAFYVTKQNNNLIETNDMETKEIKTIHLTKTDFLAKVTDYESNPEEWKYLGDKPALIDFYADWCGPCKAIAPILEELAEEYDGQIYIYKINTEEEQELAALFGIRSIPSLLFIPMEGQPQMAQGALPKATFKEAINSILLK